METFPAHLHEGKYANAKGCHNHSLFLYLSPLHPRLEKRKRWMQEWLKKREQYSHVLLLNEIRDTEPEDYKNYFRMNDITFDKLLKLVTPFLVLKDTNTRHSLPVKEILAGDQYHVCCDYEIILTKIPTRNLQLSIFGGGVMLDTGQNI